MTYASDIWNDFSPELNNEILEAAYSLEKKMYRRVVEDMAAQLRQRVNRILEMPRAERHALFKPLLGLPHFHLYSQNLLLNWLLQTQSPMLVAFLDTLGIEHDGRGQVERLPENMDETKLKTAVDKLYEKFPQEKVSVYLKAFTSISGSNWPSLAGMIRSNAPVAS